MNPAMILSIVTGALSILEVLAPEMQKMFASGEISAEEQAKIRARFEALRGPGAFTGDEWKQD